jgi:hypothetical protein
MENGTNGKKDNLPLFAENGKNGNGKLPFVF